MMGTTSSTTMQSLRKIIQRAPAIGATYGCYGFATVRSKHGVCMFFVVVILSRSEAGVLFVRGVHSSNKHCVAVYRPISTKFSGFFRRTIYFTFPSLSGATIIAKFRSKIAKIQKNLCQSLCAPLRIDS